MTRRQRIQIALCAMMVPALVAGCGGGNSTPKRTVRGIVLEDDGSGNAKPAGAGHKIYATYSSNEGKYAGGPTEVTETHAITDKQGIFSLSLPIGREYALRTDSYRASTNFFNSEYYIPSCAVLAGLVNFKSADGPLEVSYYADNNFGNDYQSKQWMSRARSLAAQYQASGTAIDVVILADLPCVAHA